MKNKTIEELEKIGDSEAFYELGSRYYYGKVVEKNGELAFKYFKKSMEMGSIKGKYGLAKCYYYGKGTEGSYEIAYKLLKELKENNLNELSENIINDIKFFEAEMYYHGQCLEKNYKKAFENFEELANTYNDKQAISYLADMYYYGRGTKKDFLKAKYYAEISEKNGDLYARAILGDIYYFGNGTDINYEMARKLYENSFDEKYDDLYYRLGKMYLEGLGGKKDEEKAITCFNKIEKDIFSLILYAVIATKEEEKCKFELILEWASYDFDLIKELVKTFPKEHPCLIYLKRLKTLKDDEYRDVADKFKEKIKIYSKEKELENNFTSEEDVEKYIDEIIESILL